MFKFFERKSPCFEVMRFFQANPFNSKQPAVLFSPCREPCFCLCTFCDVRGQIFIGVNPIHWKTKISLIVLTKSANELKLEDRYI